MQEYKQTGEKVDHIVPTTTNNLRFLAYLVSVSYALAFLKPQLLRKAKIITIISSLAILVDPLETLSYFGNHQVLMNISNFCKPSREPALAPMQKCTLASLAGNVGDMSATRQQRIKKLPNLG